VAPFRQTARVVLLHSPADVFRAEDVRPRMAEALPQLREGAITEKPATHTSHHIFACQGTHRYDSLTCCLVTASLGRGASKETGFYTQVAIGVVERWGIVHPVARRRRSCCTTDCRYRQCKSDDEERGLAYRSR
jgi:hypothetical protein